MSGIARSSEMGIVPDQYLLLISHVITSFMERTVTYFETLGPENTDITFRLARERAHELGIRKIVIASTTGATAKKAMEYFKNDGVQLVVIPHQWDFHREVNYFPAGTGNGIAGRGTRGSLRHDAFSHYRPIRINNTGSDGKPAALLLPRVQGLL